MGRSIYSFPVFKEIKELKRHPELANDFDWDGLSGHDWSILLWYLPQYADRCVWKKLSGRDCCFLLESRPQFAEYCDWGKIGAAGSVCLLQKHPQLAEYCDFDKFRAVDWLHLLCYQPQFESYVDWEILNTARRGGAVGETGGRFCLSINLSLRISVRGRNWILFSGCFFFRSARNLRISVMYGRRLAVCAGGFFFPRSPSLRIGATGRS